MRNSRHGKVLARQGDGPGQVGGVLTGMEGMKMQPKSCDCCPRPFSKPVVSCTLITCGPLAYFTSK